VGLHLRTEATGGSPDIGYRRPARAGNNDCPKGTLPLKILRSQERGSGRKKTELRKGGKKQTEERKCYFVK